MTVDYRLYVITDGKPDLFNRVEGALLGGATCIQYREKTKSVAQMIEEATHLKVLCHQYGVPLFINDYPEVAKAIGADGIHLGQSDTGLKVARGVLPPHMPIGISARTVAEAVEAQKNGAAYVGVGAMFPTHSKSDATLVSQETAKAIKDSISIPMLLIGGISLETAGQLTTSYDGLCVISAILSAENPRKAAQDLKAFV